MLASSSWMWKCHRYGDATVPILALIKRKIYYPNNKYPVLIVINILRLLPPNHPTTLPASVFYVIYGRIRTKVWISRIFFSPVITSSHILVYILP